MNTRANRHFLVRLKSEMMSTRPLRSTRDAVHQRRNTMFRLNAQLLRQGIVLAGTTIGLIAIASNAKAGECPAGSMKANARTMVDYKPVGVTDTTLGSIDLEKQPAHIAGREL